MGGMKKGSFMAAAAFLRLKTWVSEDQDRDLPGERVCELEAWRSGCGCGHALYNNQTDFLSTGPITTT